MSLQVIGAGFGRTGTMSLKLALEQLGFAKCYHMIEVFEHPEHIGTWHDAALGKPVDWDKLYDGYKAAVDWPPCHFWREYAALYPEAKVILTVRSPESWYESASQTIFRGMTMPVPANVPPHMARHREMTRAMIVDGTFGGRLDDAAHCMKVFEEHNLRVRAEIPAERLLVYKAGEGWEPLCEFLGVPVPAIPYPKTNTRDEFLARIEAMVAAAGSE